MMVRIEKRVLVFAVSLLFFTTLGGGIGVLEAQASGLEQAQALLETEQVDQALQLLDRLLQKNKNHAEAYLLRSTGRIMNGDVRGGLADLKKALRVDPNLRQGWLNLAGLEIAQGRFQEAQEALEKAQEIDPGASDNALNLGAVVLMQGRRSEAAGYFDRYLQQEKGTAEAHYLVAGNYALAGLPENAVEHLRQAVEKNERMRLRARNDERFLALDHPAYQQLLNTDAYVLPPNAHTVAAAFRVPYDQKTNRLVYAVLEALRRQKIRYDPNVEATAGWALIWGEQLRIKVSNQSNGTGVVRLSAPAEQFSKDAWHRQSQALFKVIHEQLGS